MKSLRTLATGVIRLLGEIVPNIERTTSELAESVGAFKSVVQEQFGQAAARHQESAELLARSVDHIWESAEQLSRQSGSLAQVVAEPANASQEWSRSLQGDAGPRRPFFLRFLGFRGRSNGRT